MKGAFDVFVKTSRLAYAAGFLLLVSILGVGSSGCGAEEQAKINTTDSTLQTSEGLVLEGSGPFPATLLARSNNTLSNEENQLVLQEISMELDKIIDLAGQLEVINDQDIDQKVIDDQSQAVTDGTGEEVVQ
jgi:hypothetical protein